MGGENGIYPPSPTIRQEKKHVSRIHGFFWRFNDQSVNAFHNSQFASGSNYFQSTSKYVKYARTNTPSTNDTKNMFLEIQLAPKMCTLKIMKLFENIPNIK